MKNPKRKSPWMLAPLASLLVACVGCPSPGATAAASAAPQLQRPAPAGPGLDPAVLPPVTSSAPAPAAPQAPAPVATDSQPDLFGVPVLPPAASRADDQRTNLAPELLARVPDTPAAAEQVRVAPPPAASPEPATGTTDLFGLGGDGTAPGVAPVGQPTTFALGKRDRALAFYTAYAKDWQEDYWETGRLWEDVGEVAARQELRARIEEGRRAHPEAYTAFQDLVEPHWFYRDYEPSAFRWLLSSRTFTAAESRESDGLQDGKYRIDDAELLSNLTSIFHQLFQGAPGLAGAASDLAPGATRPVDPMTAQDFYKQYLRSAHREYAGTPGWFDLDETNDFAEALATGRRANPAGYEALRQRVQGAADRQDVLEWFRGDWNKYLQLLNGYGGDAEVDRSGTEPKIGGKTQEQWKDQAEANMRKVSRALEGLF